MQMYDGVPLGMSKCLNHSMFLWSNLSLHDIDTCNCLDPTFFHQSPERKSNDFFFFFWLFTLFRFQTKNPFNLLPSICFYLRYLCKRINIVLCCNVEIWYNRSLSFGSHICTLYVLQLRRVLCSRNASFHRCGIVI